MSERKLRITVIHAAIALDKEAHEILATWQDSWIPGSHDTVAIAGADVLPLS